MASNVQADDSGGRGGRVHVATVLVRDHLEKEHIPSQLDTVFICPSNGIEGTFICKWICFSATQKYKPAKVSKHQNCSSSHCPNVRARTIPDHSVYICPQSVYLLTCVYEKELEVAKTSNLYRKSLEIYLPPSLALLSANFDYFGRSL